MKVKMKVNTYFGGFKLKDDIIEVDENTAKRWQLNNIAEILETNTNYQDMNAKELFDLCKKRNINIDAQHLKSLKTNKERKEYLLTLLN